MYSGESGGGEVVCGGRTGAGAVLADCVLYNLTSRVWKQHSTTLAAREEAVGGRFWSGGWVGGVGMVGWGAVVYVHTKLRAWRCWVPGCTWWAGRG